MDNKHVARILRETAQLLEIDGAIIGRYRTYEKAAELIEASPTHRSNSPTTRKTQELPGIGDRAWPSTSPKSCKTGDYSLRLKLLKKFPPTLLEVLNLQSLGPKKVAFLWKNSSAATVADVEKLRAKANCATSPASAKKANKTSSKPSKPSNKVAGRFLISYVEAAARENRRPHQKSRKSGGKVTPAGSLRRGKETIGDLDLLVTMPPGHTTAEGIDTVAEHILKYPGIDQVLAHGENKVSFLLAAACKSMSASLKRKFRRRPAVFHRLEGTQRRPARPRQRHGLDPQRIRARPR